MHSDLRFHIVMAVMILRDLKDTAVIAHRVIIAYGALLLNAQNVIQSGGKGHEGRAFLLGLDGETRIMAGQKALFQEPVRRVHTGDALHPQFLWQTVLQGCEHPFRPAPGFGGVTCDQFNAELV